MVKNGAEVYVSEFMVGTQLFGNITSAIPLGCTHGDDTIILFGADEWLLPLPGTSKQELRELSDNVIQAWSSFAKGQ